MKLLGQARKSLWIETDEYGTGDFPGMVRLVRACGSKRYTVRNDVSLAGVRLVRACGSKLCYTKVQTENIPGQARKSLWIETGKPGGAGQAHTVRLVRACGSKPSSSHNTEAPCLVRLVRACGSKLKIRIPASSTIPVRLVRACGSKQTFFA